MEQRYRTNFDGSFSSPIKPSFNQPSFNNYNTTLTVKQAVGIDDDTRFGIELYKVPKFSLEKRISGFSPSKEKRFLVD
jgi:hypothetical protein